MKTVLGSTFGLLVFASAAICQVPIPPHSSLYTGYSRGFNFTAQTAFNIVQLDLPMDAYQAGDLAGYMVRVNGNIAVHSVGNAGAINVNVPIVPGDIVDVIGNWSPVVPAYFSAHNSYTASMTNFATTIEGVPHTIQRCGWQWDISDPAYASGAFLAATTGQMGRINMYTSSGGMGTVFSTATAVGTGCVDRASATFYETFPQSTFDLSNTSLMLIPSGNGYVALPGSANWWTPVGSNLGLTDDSVSGALPLGFTLPYPGGVTNDVYASSNGFVWAQSSTVNGCCTGDPAGFVAGAARWSMLWNDLNPTLGGTVVFDQDPVGGAAYLTYTGIAEYGQAANLNTFQIAFFSTGVVEYRWQAIAITAHQALVGWTPGLTRDPGTIDISAATAIVTQPDMTGLRLASNQRPIANSLISLTTSNITATAPFGAVLLGLSNPGLPLDPLGMAGCTQYTDGMVTLLFLPLGAPSVATPITVPNMVNLTMMAQSFLYDPAAGATALGATSSNGMSLLIGDW